jgi:hypothetical protein
VTLQEYQELKRDREGGLISARGALAGLDEAVDAMCEAIYEAREKEKGRAVEL